MPICEFSGFEPRLFVSDPGNKMPSDAVRLRLTCPDRGHRNRVILTLMLAPLHTPAGQHFGALRNDYSRDALGLYEIAYEPRLRMPKHSHELSRYILVLQGSVTHEARTEEHIGPGGAVCVPRDRTHTDAVGDSGTLCFMVEPGPAWLARFDVPEPPSDHACPAGPGPELPLMLVRLRHECGAADAASRLIVDGLMIEIFGHIHRAATAHGLSSAAWLRTIRDLLHDRFRDTLTIRGLAAEAGVHPVHLCREFRRHNGVTIGAYVRRLRIEYACTQLTNSDRSLTDIALDAGFSSHAHFTSTFRRIVGFSPKAFRNCRTSR